MIADGAEPAWVEMPEPRPGEGEIGVRIAACGLNFADLLMIRGEYQERPALPFTLGLELAGTVTEVGAGVSDFRPGDRVAVFAGSGGLAEAGAFPAARAVLLPASMGFDEAAGFQIAYGTSHLALTDRAALQPGETLLVLGAAGGVGLTAVEIGKAMGARVIAAARGADKLAVARLAGADHLIDTDRDDLRDSVKALGGADVVYDPVGGALFTAALRACKPKARIVVIGFASGNVPQIPANILLVKNITVIGFYWGGYLAFDPGRLRASLSHLLEWRAEGRIRPHLSQVLPRERAAEGLALLRDRKTTGKVVIRI
jgi:NADPH2:quinone reductase